MTGDAHTLIDFIFFISEQGYPSGCPQETISNIEWSDIAPSKVNIDNTGHLW